MGFLTMTAAILFSDEHSRPFRGSPTPKGWNTKRDHTWSELQYTSRFCFPETKSRSFQTDINFVCLVWTVGYIYKDDSSIIKSLRPELVLLTLSVLLTLLRLNNNAYYLRINIVTRLCARDCCRSYVSHPPSDSKTTNTPAITDLWSTEKCAIPANKHERKQTS